MTSGRRHYSGNDGEPLSRSGRCLVLAVAFLGWLCAGFHMPITQLTAQPAAIDLLDSLRRDWKVPASSP